MKQRIFIIFIFTALILSCYQGPESSTGSISVKLDSSIMKDAPAGFDGELRLAVFDGGDLDSLIDISGEPEISYLGDFPTPLLVNNSVPVIGRSGVLSLLNVPSDKPLELLIEYDGGYWDPEDIPPYYHSYSGVSEEFEVEGGGTAEVAVTLIQTAYGGISFNLLGSPDGSFMDSGYYVYFLSPEDFDSQVTISGDTLDYDPWSISSYDSDDASEVSYPVELPDMLPPGMKFRILVSNSYPFPPESHAGASDSFEVQPGRLTSVSVNYYEYIGPSGS